MNEIIIPVKNGKLEVIINCSSDYPGVDIEFVPDNAENKGVCTFPRVLVEYPADGHLQVLVWNTPDKEDYSEKIIMSTSY